MVSDDIIDIIVELLNAVGVTPAEIQELLDAIQAGAREELVELLQQYGVPQAVIQYLLELLPYI